MLLGDVARCNVSAKPWQCYGGELGDLMLMYLIEIQSHTLAFIVDAPPKSVVDDHYPEGET
jgi:hypothetical protein